jgi:hypothetical protein
MDLIRHLLFENPLSLWIALGLVAVTAGAIWTRTRSEKALWVAAGSVMAGLGLAVLAWAVETDREKVIRTLDMMASAVEKGQTTALIERVSPEYKNGRFSKDDLAAAVTAALPRIRISGAGDPTITMGDGEATVQQQYVFQIQQGSDATFAGVQIPVTWEGRFAPDPDGQWRLRSAIAIKPERVTPEEAARHVRQN